MTFREALYAKLHPPTLVQNPYQPVIVDQTLPVQETPTSATIPVGVQQFADMADRLLPAVEQMTGLSRREITLQLLKSGLRGNSLSGILDGLMGTKPAPEPKFVKYVKVGAIWIPIAILLLGCSIVAVFAFFKLTMLVIGSL